MQQSEKTFGSQIAMKQLYRQYSGTIKNYPRNPNKTMTQSSNLPFDKIYNAFNSSANMKNLTLDKLKNSQAKSIIEKLMQTKEPTLPKKDTNIVLFNDLPNPTSPSPTSAIPLSSTQAKIFYQVINLLTQIESIKEKASTEKDEFLKIRAQLKKQGIQIPEIQEKKNQSNQNSIFKRLTSNQLEQIYDQNDLLMDEIQKITQQLTNLNQNGNQQDILKQVMKQNSQLKKQLSNVRSQVVNAGQFDEKDINQMTIKVQQLSKTVYQLEQKRLQKLTDSDQQLRTLKSQNQKLRIKTIQALKLPNDPIQTKRKQLIQFLQAEQRNKQFLAQQIQTLKNKYESLKAENSKLTQNSYNRNDNPLQVESKVSPFQTTSFGQYNRLYGADKQSYYANKENYYTNFESQRFQRYY